MLELVRRELPPKTAASKSLCALRFATSRACAENGSAAATERPRSRAVGEGSCSRDGAVREVDTGGGCGGEARRGTRPSHQRALGSAMPPAGLLAPVCEERSPLDSSEKWCSSSSSMSRPSRSSANLRVRAAGTREVGAMAGAYSPFAPPRIATRPCRVAHLDSSSSAGNARRISSAISKHSHRKLSLIHI